MYKNSILFPTEQYEEKGRLHKLESEKKILLMKRREINNKLLSIEKKIEQIESHENNVHPGNILNDLSEKEWMKFKKSWFVLDEFEKEWEVKKIHPATYPATIPEIFIKFFTKKRNIVLDPMCGVGSTLTACDRTDRVGIGIDLNPKYCEIAKRLTQQKIMCADSTKLLDLDLPRIDYCIFSPPYHNILHKSKGGVITRHKLRIQNGLDEVYSNDSRDLGNVGSEEEFLQRLELITDGVYELLKEGKFMTIIVQNEVGINFNPIAWKIGLRLSNKWFLKPERIWCQETKPVTIHGHPKTFVTNNHHHYCLNFQKLREENRPSDITKT